MIFRDLREVKKIKKRSPAHDLRLNWHSVGAMTNRMPKVTADSEEVIFDGEVPGQPARIYELIMIARSEQGRAVVQFLVDGEDALQAG